MGAFISRQPNGLLCRHSTVVDCVTHYNMTDEDYIELCAERAREEARHTLEARIYPFQSVIDSFRDFNMTKSEFKEILDKMNMPKEECSMEET